MKFFDIKFFLQSWTVPLLSFSVLWDKISPAGKRDMSHVCVNFFDTGKIQNHRIVPLRKFSIFRDWNFQRKKNVIPSAHIKKISDTRNIPKYRIVPLRHFSPQLHRKIPTENLISTSYGECFWMPEFFWYTEGPSTKFLILWDKIFPTEKRDFTLLCIKFIGIGIFLKPREAIY